MITIVGKCMGTKPKTFNNVTSYSFGIAEPKHGAFQGEEEIIEIKVGKEFNTPEFLNRIDKLHGKTVSLSVTFSQGQFNGKNYASFHTTGTINEVSAPGAVKAA